MDGILKQPNNQKINIFNRIIKYYFYGFQITNIIKKCWLLAMKKTVILKAPTE
jgi:hypothetical protein